jgi:hypothetical protein
VRISWTQISWLRVGAVVAAIVGGCGWAGLTLFLVQLAVEHLRARGWALLIIGLLFAASALGLVFNLKSAGESGKRFRLALIGSTVGLGLLALLVALLGHDILCLTLGIAGLAVAGLACLTYVTCDDHSKTAMLFFCFMGLPILGALVIYPAMLVIVCPAAIVVGVVFFVVVQHIATLQRSRRMAALAARLGLRFEARRSTDLPGQLAQFQTFSDSQSLEVRNLLAGNIAGWQVAFFDCGAASYEWHADVLAQPPACSVAVAALPRHCPRLEIRPAESRDILAARLGFGGVQFESEGFNHRYRVDCADRRLAFAMVTPRAIGLLMRTRKWIVEFSGQAVLLRSEEPVLPWKPEDRQGWCERLVFAPAPGVEEALKLLAGLLETIPDYVWEEFGSEIRRAGHGRGNDLDSGLWRGGDHTPRPAGGALQPVGGAQKPRERIPGRPGNRAQAPV